MSITMKFPSLLRPQERIYTYHWDSMALWDAAWRSTGPLDPRMGWFPTYGDGQTQHGPECPVLAADAADYFASLAEYLLRPDLTEEERRTGAQILDGAPTAKQCQFALSFEYKENKRAYFDPRGLKVSSRASLSHDRRWFPVREVHNGTVDGAIAVLSAGEEHDPWIFRWWVRRETIRAHTTWSEPTAKVILRTLAPTAIANDGHELYERAFTALRLAVEALAARETAERQLGHFKRLDQERREQPVEPKVAHAV